MELFFLAEWEGEGEDEGAHALYFYNKAKTERWLCVTASLEDMKAFCREFSYQWEKVRPKWEIYSSTLKTLREIAKEDGVHLLLFEEGSDTLESLEDVIPFPAPTSASA
jgi:hypothetical protein